MTTKVDPHRLGHQRRGIPEFVGDSRRAILDYQHQGIKVVDLNLVFDIDEVAANQHWREPLRRGWKDPHNPPLPDGVKMRHLHWHQWHRFEAYHDGQRYHMSTMRSQMHFAFGNGMHTVEADMKDMPPSAKALERMLVGFEDETVWFKTMATLSDGRDKTVGRPWVRLRMAKEVTGRTTMLLCHRPGILVPAAYEQDIDYYRGFRPIYVGRKS